jgi:hypothetical protein
LTHDLLYLVSMVAWLAIAWLTSRLPVRPPPPRTYEEAAAQQRVGCIVGGFLLLFVVAGAGIGYAIPQFTAESVPPVRINILDPHHGVDALGRFAQVVGVLLGGWVGLRGGWLWLIVMLAGYLLAAATGVLQWIVQGKTIGFAISDGYRWPSIDLA